MFLSLRSLFFSNERQRGSGSGGEEGGKELGGVEEGETVIRIYYVREESIFNNKKTCLVISRNLLQ